MSDTHSRRPYVIWAAVAVFTAALLVATGFVVGNRHGSNRAQTYDDPFFDTWDDDTTTISPVATTTTVAVPTRGSTTTTARPTTTTEAPAFDVTSLVGTDYGTDQFMQVMGAYGCREWFGLYVPGSYLSPGSGIDCKPGGLMISVAVTSIKITDIGMVAEGYEGGNWSAFEGDLPFGLRWGMTAPQANAMLEAEFGPPINHFDPAGGSTNYSMDDYDVTSAGLNYAGLQGQFNGTTGALERVSVSLDAPTQWP